MLQYLTDRYQNGRDVSQEGLDVFFSAKDRNYYTWLEWMIANVPQDDD